MNKKELNLKIPDIETLTKFLMEEGEKCLRPEILYWLEGAELSEAICQKFSRPQISVDELAMVIKENTNKFMPLGWEIKVAEAVKEII